MQTKTKWFRPITQFASAFLLTTILSWIAPYLVWGNLDLLAERISDPNEHQFFTERFLSS
ncbi:MAG: hypothetical protein ACPG8W_24535 [Candidatus Promineifilaceae bacterium]